MSNRVISDPTVGGWKLDPATGYWMWAGVGSAYDDTEVRGLISANSDRIDALEDGGGSFWVEESPGVI